MKSFLLIIVCILLITSCSKDSNHPQSEWKWIYSYTGGYISNKINPSANTTVILSLQTDSDFTVYLNGKENVQGKYLLTETQSSYNIHFYKAVSIDKLNLNEDMGYKIYSNDTLVLYDQFI